MKTPKIAIVCDWLTDWGGAERVILAMHRLFPEAPIYTSLYNASNLPQFDKVDVRPSYLQRIPGAYRHHQRFIAQMPGAFESFDLSEFDIVLSSSHSFAKGVVTKPETMHVSYCHSPPRYLWDNFHQYVDQYPWPKILKRLVIPKILHNLRIWDRAAADRVDLYIANSRFITNRIRKYYRRESTVIYPPVEMSEFEAVEKDDYFLAVGRLIPYKRFDLIIDTFNELKLPLKVIGLGNQFKTLQKKANDNIEFLGKVPEEELRRYYRYAKALIFPQIEDFGITPVEAMAYGCPVIAYKGGGALETVKDKVSGLFFEEQTVDALKGAVLKFQQSIFDPYKVREQAETFHEDVFTEALGHYLEEEWAKWLSSINQ
jgi:glycosyltransferase involved in cell wall biosynthesis